MDSGKNQQALMPGKSIFKDTALGSEYREIAQRVPEVRCFSVEVMLLSHEISEKLQSYSSESRLGVLFIILPN